MYKLKYGVTGFLIGAVFFGSFAWAATNKIEVSFDPVKFMVDNVDKTPANGNFNNNGTSVPASIIYNGTTYVPLKLVEIWWVNQLLGMQKPSLYCLGILLRVEII